VLLDPSDSPELDLGLSARRPAPRRTRRSRGAGRAPAVGSSPGHAAPHLTYAERLYAVRSVVGERPVFVGPSAAWAHDSETSWDDDPVHLNVDDPHALRCRDGVVVHQSELRDSEIVLTRYGRATSPHRTAIDLACADSRPLALSRLDALARVRHLDLAALLAEAHAVRGRRGIRQARELIPLVDRRAESPRESMLRLAIHDFGLPPPTPQLVVTDAWGHVVARLDFGWERERVGIEYDGRVHLDGAVHGRDLRRHNELRADGWVVFQVDAVAYRDPTRVLQSVAAVLTARSSPHAETDPRNATRRGSL
jgi:hypothetical protein